MLIHRHHAAKTIQRLAPFEAAKHAARFAASHRGQCQHCVVHQLDHNPAQANDDLCAELRVGAATNHDLYAFRGHRLDQYAIDTLQAHGLERIGHHGFIGLAHIRLGA